MEIFTIPQTKESEVKELNPAVQLAAIATKDFIASPVFATQVKISNEPVIDGSSLRTGGN